LPTPLKEPATYGVAAVKFAERPRKLSEEKELRNCIEKLPVMFLDWGCGVQQKGPAVVRKDDVTACEATGDPVPGRV